MEPDRIARTVALWADDGNTLAPERFKLSSAGDECDVLTRSEQASTDVASDGARTEDRNLVHPVTGR
jgi:predicted metallo-beta-lactamase superfamily hydrolase